MNLLDKIAYDSGGFTVQEILSSFCKKILEIIDLVNKNEEVCDDAHTLIENIRNEVVPELVEDIMKELQDSGYFDSLVNVTLIEQLRTELTELLNQTITDFTSRLDNFDSQLDNITINLESLNIRGTSQDNLKDDSDNIQIIIDKNYYTRFQEGKVYYVNKPIKIRPYSIIDFNGCWIVPYGSEMENKFIFYVNTDDGITDNGAVVSHTFIKNLNIENAFNINGVKGINAFSPIDVKCLKTKQLYQSILIGDRYFDRIIMDDIKIEFPQGDEYQITQKGESNRLAHGDAWVLNRLQIENGETRKLLYLGGNNTCGEISNVINGEIYIKNGSWKMKNLHIEVGHLTIQNADVEIDNAVLLLKRDTLGHKITILCDEEGNSRDVSLKNIFFNYDTWNDDNSLEKGRFYTNILVDENFGSNIYINNVSKGMTKSNAQGVVIRKTGASQDLPYQFYPELNNNSVIDLGKINQPNVTQSLCPSKGVNFINVEYKEVPHFASQTSDKTGYKWYGESGRYYYKVGVILDWNRKIGVYDNREFYFDINKNYRASVIFSVDKSMFNQVKNASLIIYRGIESGKYDDMCVVPLVNVGSKQIDTFNTVGLCRWISGENMTPMELTNHVVVDNLVTDNVITKGGVSAPTIGTWKKGDEVINNNRASGQPHYWRCINSGTPGTWVAYGKY